MKEIFVIYNEGIVLPDDGYPLDGGSGRIDRAWDSENADGSTVSEGIVRVLARKSGRKVVYFNNRDLPVVKKHKIKDGEIVDLTEDDLAAIEAAKPKSEIDLLKERLAALEAK